MFNLIGILILLSIEAIIIYTFYKCIMSSKEIEIDKSRQTINELIETIKQKNNIIKELQNESKRRNNTRLWKIH